MCRLYGFRANEPTKVECTLVLAQNALMVQSRADLRGKSHSDGWGISVYEDHLPRIERRATAAFEDIHFSTTAERIYSHVVVAHVRRATIGVTALENTHPFQYRHWTFAHNGTVTGFDEVGERLRRETAPALAGRRRGTTDSETVFYWLLTRMSSAGIQLEQGGAKLSSLVDVVGQSVTDLARWCAEADEKPSQLNLMLTDGDSLVATRCGHTLYRIERHDLHDCEICGIPHVRHDRNTEYRAVVIASEPISHEPWQEVPERTVIAVGDDMRLRMHSM